MALTRLFCQHLRCIESAEIFPNPGINIIYGENGAGKTSILEAIHILSTGRSFRTTRIRDVIQNGKDSLVVAGKIANESESHNLGIQRWKDHAVARINQQTVKHIASLSAAIPVIAFHPGSSRLITEDPAERRAFLDWGVFQVFPDFLADWRNYRHILRQRNAALKANKPGREISLWDDQLADSAERIHQMRQVYLVSVKNRLPGIAEKFSLPFALDIVYRAGWNTDKTFKKILADNLERDRSLGYTYAGPHRADLNILLDQHAASAMASRGQLKLITIILKLLQAELYSEKTGRSAILLLDDLPSELDQYYLSETCAVLEALNSQLFISMVEPDQSLFTMHTMKTFHVEHGVVTVG